MYCPLPQKNIDSGNKKCKVLKCLRNTLIISLKSNTFLQLYIVDSNGIPLYCLFCRYEIPRRLI